MLMFWNLERSWYFNFVLFKKDVYSSVPFTLAIKDWTFSCWVYSATIKAVCTFRLSCLERSWFTNLSPNPSTKDGLAVPIPQLPRAAFCFGFRPNTSFPCLERSWCWNPCIFLATSGVILMCVMSLHICQCVHVWSDLNVSSYTQMYVHVRNIYPERSGCAVSKSFLYFNFNFL